MKWMGTHYKQESISETIQKIANITAKPPKKETMSPEEDSDQWRKLATFMSGCN